MFRFIIVNISIWKMNLVNRGTVEMVGMWHQHLKEPVRASMNRILVDYF